MAILYTRNSGAPPHLDYQYFIPGYQGENSHTISFSRYSVEDENGRAFQETYFYNGIEIDEDAYVTLTKPLLSIGDGKIIWNSLPTN